MNLCPDKGTEQGFLDKPCCDVLDMRFDTLYRLNERESQRRDARLGA